MNGIDIFVLVFAAQLVILSSVYAVSEIRNANKAIGKLKQITKHNEEKNRRRRAKL